MSYKNRKINTSNIPKIKKGEQVLKTSCNITEAFNSHFTTNDEKLACEIPESEVHPLTYLQLTDSSFTFQKITS